MDERDVVTNLLHEIDELADTLDPADQLSLAAALTAILLEQDFAAEDTNPSPTNRKKGLLYN